MNSEWGKRNSEWRMMNDEWRMMNNRAVNLVSKIREITYVFRAGWRLHLNQRLIKNIKF